MIFHRVSPSGVTLLQLDSVAYSDAGSDPLFEDVTFSVAAGDRLALVAPNGVGKSTLLKVVAGDLVTGGRDWEELDRLAREEGDLGKRLEAMVHEWAELGALG